MILTGVARCLATFTPKEFLGLLVPSISKQAPQVVELLLELSRDAEGSVGRRLTALIDRLRGRAMPCEFEPEWRCRDEVLGQVADYDLVIDLVGGVQEHLTRIPFHTTILSWSIEDRTDPEAVYKQLAPRISDLVELLRGEDED